MLWIKRGSENGTGVRGHVVGARGPGNLWCNENIKCRLIGSVFGQRQNGDKKITPKSCLLVL